MDPKAIAKAKSRLRLAEKSVRELAACQNHQDFSDQWYGFLVAAKNVYTSLEQGSKVSPPARQWYGGKKQERRDDPLLQYLFQARDDDEHGLEPVTEFDPGGIGIQVNKPGFSQGMLIERLTVMDDGEIQLKAKSLDGKPILIEQTLPHTKLAVVTGRGGVKYQPPTGHLGKALESGLPLPVAELAVQYLTRLISEAEGFCKQ